MKIYFHILPVLLSVIFSGCVQLQNGSVFTPKEGLWQPKWSENELAQEIVVRNLRFTPETSHHIIRLITTERPHIHKDHDLTVFVLKGKALMHLGEERLVINAGDVIEILRGLVHWAENLENGGSEVYAIFNPPYYGKDHHPVTELSERFTAEE